MQRRLFSLIAFHLPLKVIQRLNMPQTFACNGAKGQRAKEVCQKDFRYVKYLLLAKRFQRPFIAPIIDCGFAITRQGSNLLYSHNILILFQKPGVIIVHLAEHFFG